MALSLAAAASADREWAAIARRYPARSRPSTDPRPGSLWPRAVRDRVNLAARALGDAQVALIVASPGLGIACLRRGRGAGHVAAILAGGLATLGAAMAAWQFWLEPPALAALGQRAALLHDPSWRLLVGRVQGFNGLFHLVAWTILAAWITLVASGRRQPPRDPLDRLGRWLGWAWLGEAACDGLILLVFWS